MDIKKEVKELASEFQELKKLEMEIKMKMGKYDERATALMLELGVSKESNVNVVEVLNAALNKSSLIL